MVSANIISPSILTKAEKDKLISLFNAGDYAGTELLASAMTLNFPHDAFGWKALGAVLKLAGRYSDALVPMQNAVRLVPGDAEAHNNLGAVFTDLGMLTEAEESCRRAIYLNPDFPEAYNNLGYVLYKAERFNEAEEMLKKAVAVKLDYAEAYNNLGNVLREQIRFKGAENNYIDDALFCYFKAVAIKIDYAEAYSNMGAILHEAGRFNEAADNYRKALSIKQDFAECHRNLSQIKKFTKDDQQIAVLRSLYETSEKEPDRAHICFALAKACEDLGEIDEAFGFYAEGNRLRKKELQYTIENDRNIFRAVRSVFDKLPAEVLPAPPHSKTPILIVGMPRSGTSLVEQILASHPGVYGAGEIELLNNAVKINFTGEPVSDPALLSREIASAYLDKLEAIGKERRFVVDKMPFNFRWLGFLLSAQPDIKIVHTTRDGMAVCWSNFRQYFTAKGLGFTYDMEDMAEYYRLYEDLMQFWKERFPERIYDLNYERLTENQEEETRKLLDYCGLSWDARCLEFENTERAVMTASAAQVRSKIYKGSSEAWRRFEKHLGPLISALKYNTNKTAEN